jgi:hypothetical protein
VSDDDADLFDRKVIGRAFSDDLDSGRTVIPALEMAVRNRSASPGLLFHSDRGVQYCSKAFRELLRLRCVRPFGRRPFLFAGQGAPKPRKPGVADPHKARTPRAYPQTLHSPRRSLPDTKRRCFIPRRLSFMQ